MVSFPPVSLPRPYTPPLLTHTRHMPSPSHSSRFYHPQSGLFCLQRKHPACECFLTGLLNREGLLAPRPTPKLEDHPLAVHDCLFNLFAATLHVGGRSSIRNLRTRHAVVTGTHYMDFRITRKKERSLNKLKDEAVFSRSQCPRRLWTWVCGGSVAGMSGSNSVGAEGGGCGMDVCLLCLLSFGR